MQTNLVSDIPGLAAHTDSNLVNPWGIAYGPTSPFWISDNRQGVSTLYDGTGSPLALIVTIPPPPGSPAGTKSFPTGVVFNGTADFKASHFIFATEDGTIAAWSSGTSAMIEVDNSPANAVYKGLALGHNGSGNFLFATNFRSGRVDVFDKNFGAASGFSFTDPTIPAGFAPFGIQNIGGNLYVTYAMQDASKHDDVAGPGNGYVDVFDTDGNFVRRFASTGALNSPWGLALSPAGFGTIALLVGNFGDGRINAFDPTSGAFMGPLLDQHSAPIEIGGLWGLIFGNGGVAGAKNTLFFTAGINGEDNGLFGSLQLPSPGPAPAMDVPGLTGLALVLVGSGLVMLKKRGGGSRPRRGGNRAPLTRGPY